MNDEIASRGRLTSRQVSWWEVHEYIQPRLTAQEWPMAGSPAWCELADDDPVKLAAVFDAAQHWALRIELSQETHKAAALAIAASQDWRQRARELSDRKRHYIPRVAS